MSLISREVNLEKKKKYLASFQLSIRDIWGYFIFVYSYIELSKGGKMRFTRGSISCLNPKVIDMH